MKLDKYDAKIAHGSHPDNARPMLQQVCLRDGRLAAADGFMLVVRDADFEDGEVLKDKEQVLLPANIMKLLRPSAKKPAKMLMDEEGNITVKYLNDTTGEVIEPTLAFKPDKLSSEYPRYDELFPPAKKNHEVCISVNLLRKLLQCFPTDGYLRLGFMGENSAAIEFSVTGEMDNDYDSQRPIRGCLMPMFINWEEHKWFRDIKPEQKEEEIIKEKEEVNV